MVGAAFRYVRHVLSRPVQRGHLDRNPCDLVDGISEPKVNPATKARRRITEEDAADFIAWLYGQELNGKLSTTSSSDFVPSRASRSAVQKGCARENTGRPSFQRYD